MQILVRAPNWIGDQIIAYPFFRALRQKFPEAKITVACVPWVADVQFQNLVDEVVVVASGTKGHIRAGLRLKRSRGASFDWAIALPNSFGSALFVWLAGASRRRGYATEGRSMFLNERRPWDPNPLRHRGQAYLDLLDDAGQVLAGDFDPKRSWPHATPTEPPTEPFWIVAPGATAPARQWHRDRFGRLISAAWKERGWVPMLVGGPNEITLGKRLEEQARERGIPVVNRIAQGPVTSLWKCFAKANMTVCNESGLAHVASLCGSPVHIVCGAADPRRTAPLGVGRVEVMTNPVECWPCEKNHCPQKGAMYLACLKGIEWETVWSEINKRVRT